MNADLNRFGAPGAFLNRLVLGFHFGLVFWTIVPDLVLGLGATLTVAAAAALLLLLLVVVLPEETTFLDLEEEEDDDDDGEVEECLSGI